MTATFKINIEELKPKFIKKLQQQFKNAAVELKVIAASEKMDEGLFWEIIAALDWNRGEDIEAILKPAVTHLAQLEVEDIFAFHDLLAEKLFHLDHKIYAQNLGKDAWHSDRPFSSDNFLYSRACVVANGKEFYEKVLANPTLMPKEFTFEDLLDLAGKAYQKMTGKEFDYLPTTSYETFSNPDGWDWTLKDRLLG